MRRAFASSIAALVLAIALSVSGGNCAYAQDSTTSDGRAAPELSPIGIDYTPDTRCSDNNPGWSATQRPVACNPQLGAVCRGTLSTCPALCQQCYDDDLAFIRRNLKVNAITIYAPNYYVLKAAHRLGMKVVVGLYNDSVLGLATPAGQTNCSVGGTPIFLCGSDYASALIEGACIDQTGGNPFGLCIKHCAVRSDPARDCKKADCACDSDPDCPGAGNRCRNGAHITPLDNAGTGDFLRNGTVAAIQLGNEYLGQCQIPEVPGRNQPCCARSKKTGQCRAWIVNRDVYSAAAKTLRRALNARGLHQVKISVGLAGGQGAQFCQNGAPPPGIDYIAAHPYCDFVAATPHAWTTLKGAECWSKARAQLALDQRACGAQHTYIGETGFNSGCPLDSNGDGKLQAERDFVRAMLGDEPACKGKRDGAAEIPDFLFEFGDSCPPGGCLTGCGDREQCNPECCCKHRCSETAKCSPNCPNTCFGNGYFGLYHTPHYGTAGFPPEPKFDPVPSLLCPAQK